MTCYHPLKAWQSKRCNSNGKRTIVFSFPTRYEDYEHINLPCGQCVGCRLDRSKQWAIRCVHEAKLHAQNCFLTLTYSDENIRWSAVTGEQTLFKRDVQLFLKRLRKFLYPIKVRFFLCGEYGDETNRPHYHCILFGYDFDDKRFYKFSKGGFPYFNSDTLDRLWGLGHCVVADVTFDTCAYTARYMMKKSTGKEAKERYEGIQPEFVNMSRRPGIGHDWYQKYKTDVYPYDEVVIIEKDKTRVCRPPKYYDKLFDLEDSETLSKIKEKRIEKGKAKEHEIYEVGRMAAKEKYKLAQIRNLKRSVE